MSPELASARPARNPNGHGDKSRVPRTVGRQTGVALLVVEQKVREALAISQRVYSLKLGRVAFIGSSADLKDNRGKLRDLFL